jgi:hypothetical protein
MTVEYHRLGNDPQNGLMLKYKLAKAITFISLAAIISITISSFLYPGKTSNVIYCT